MPGTIIGNHNLIGTWTQTQEALVAQVGKNNFLYTGGGLFVKIDTPTDQTVGRVFVGLAETPNSSTGWDLRPLLSSPVINAGDNSHITGIMTDVLV